MFFSQAKLFSLFFSCLFALFVDRLKGKLWGTLQSTSVLRAGHPDRVFAREAGGRRFAARGSRFTLLTFSWKQNPYAAIWQISTKSLVSGLRKVLYTLIFFCVSCLFLLSSLHVLQLLGWQIGQLVGWLVCSSIFIALKYDLLFSNLFLDAQHL